MRNYKDVFEKIVEGVIKYVESNQIKTLVIGCSGGIDSTVDSAICKEVFNRCGVPLIGVSLPCLSNKDGERSAAKLCGEEFCNEFYEIPMQKTFVEVKNFTYDASGERMSSVISQGNIKARLRMIALYDIASKTNGIVVGNGNLTEFLLGFFTKNGDVGDISPIGNLWKHEVYGLAHWLKNNVYKESVALEQSIALEPTDGNGVSNSDLDQIMPNHTYDDVDKVLMAWVNGHSEGKTLADELSSGCLKEMCELYGEDNVEKVILRNIRTEYKRKSIPTISID